MRLDAMPAADEDDGLNCFVRWEGLEGLRVKGSIGSLTRWSGADLRHDCTKKRPRRRQKEKTRHEDRGSGWRTIEKLRG